MEIILQRFGIIVLLLFSLVVQAQEYETFEHEGMDRSYIFYKPSSAIPGCPLLMVMHGYSGNAEGIMDYTAFNDLADTHGFAVCYPQGSEDDFGNNFFNVGYEFNEDSEVDDVSFITELSTFLQGEHNLSSYDTFATGFSNGGDMCFVLACEATDHFRALAPIAGTMMEDNYEVCAPETVLPLFAMHGTEDDVTLWEGDYDNIGGWGAYISISAIIEFWTDLSSLNGPAIQLLDDINEFDGSIVERQTYVNGEGFKKFEFYKIIDGGHDWPGAWGNMDINTSELIWDYFSYVMTNEIYLNTQEEFIPNKDAQLLKVIDQYGREINKVVTGIQLHLYDDGSVQFRVRVD